jgi:hypothetical protein
MKLKNITNDLSQINSANKRYASGVRSVSNEHYNLIAIIMKPKN